MLGTQEVLGKGCHDLCPRVPRRTVTQSGALGKDGGETAPLSLACWEWGGRNSPSPSPPQSVMEQGRQELGLRRGRAHGGGPAAVLAQQLLLPPIFWQVKPVVSQFLHEKQLPYNEDSYLARFWLFLSRYEELMVQAPPITELVGLQ